MNDNRYILVIADESPEMEIALEYACARSKKTSRKIIIATFIEPLDVLTTQGVSEFGLGSGVFRFNKTRIDNIKLESSAGFLVADGTDGSSTNENERLHLEDSLCTNFEERLILESATIFDYVENTAALPRTTVAEFTFDSSSQRFDQTLFTFDSTL